MEWQTDAGNAAAQRFYAGLGAVPHGGKVFYRIDGAEIGRFAAY